MSSSAYYLRKRNQYKNLRTKLQSSLSYFGGCFDSMKTSSYYLENIIFENKTFDDGKLMEEYSKLSKVKENIQTVIKECTNKISYYQRLYNNALAQERAAREKENS